MTAFPDDVVQAVVTHMNDDHAAAALAIVRVLGGVPQAERVETVGVDDRSISFLAHHGGATTPVTVPFAEPATDRAGLRAAVVELSSRAG